MASSWLWALIEIRGIKQTSSLLRSRYSLGDCPMRLIVPMVAALILAGVGRAEDAAKKEMAKLEGEWSMVSGKANGQEMPAEMVATGKRVAKGGETTISIGGRLYFKAKFTIDPGQKPKAIDYEMTDGPTKGKTQRGIYELDGDTVKF